MKKLLSEMTYQELWKLFPIIVVGHNDNYKSWYEIEHLKLLDSIDQHKVKRINHIGSSAVKGLISKATIDILLETDDHCDIEALVEPLTENGWILMNRKSKPFSEIIFCKGYTPDGFEEKVYHLHVRHLGDWNELYFRDFLMIHPDVAKEYGKLKLCLAKDFKHDRDGYTQAKTDFILKYSAEAKLEFINRYNPEVNILADSP